MAKILITYYSRTGNTEAMAKAIEEGVKQVSGVSVVLKRVEETTVDDLLEADGIIMGSPTYYGQMAAKLKDLIDKSVEVHGKLSGKVGMAFTSAGGEASGAETTLLSILQAMLIHGMIVKGVAREMHYGLVCIGKPKEEDLNECRRRGREFAELVKRITS